MRKQSVRLEDVQSAEKYIIGVIYNHNATQAERFHAALLLQSLSPARIEALSRLVPEFKTNRDDFVHPSVIRKQRSNCAPFPTQPIKRNVRKLWCPNGHLPPAIRLKG